MLLHPLFVEAEDGQATGLLKTQLVHGHPADPAATVFLGLLLQNYTDKFENVKTFFFFQSKKIICCSLK